MKSLFFSVVSASNFLISEGIYLSALKCSKLLEDPRLFPSIDKYVYPEIDLQKGIFSNNLDFSSIIKTSYSLESFLTDYADIIGDNIDIVNKTVVLECITDIRDILSTSQVSNVHNPIVKFINKMRVSYGVDISRLLEKNRDFQSSPTIAFNFSIFNTSLYNNSQMDKIYEMYDYPVGNNYQIYQIPGIIENSTERDIFRYFMGGTEIGPEYAYYLFLVTIDKISDIDIVKRSKFSQIFEKYMRYQLNKKATTIGITANIVSYLSFGLNTLKEGRVPLQNKIENKIENLQKQPQTKETQIQIERLKDLQKNTVVETTSKIFGTADMVFNPVSSTISSFLTNAQGISEQFSKVVEEIAEDIGDVKRQGGCNQRILQKRQNCGLQDTIDRMTDSLKTKNLFVSSTKRNSLQKANKLAMLQKIIKIMNGKQKLSINLKDKLDIDRYTLSQLGPKNAINVLKSIPSFETYGKTLEVVKDISGSFNLNDSISSQLSNAIDSATSLTNDQLSALDDIADSIDENSSYKEDSALANAIEKAFIKNNKQSKNSKKLSNLRASSLKNTRFK